MTDQEQSLASLPFHALNDFMRNDYRLQVVRTVLNALPGLPDDQRLPIERLTRMLVNVAGFRNSAKAPVSLRVRPTAEAFAKSPHLAAAILEAWAGLHVSLHQQVYDLLAERNWELLPVDADRANLPGLQPTWPKGESFEIINNAFHQKYPDGQPGEGAPSTTAAPFTDDDISLMAVWVSGRLPYLTNDDKPSEN